jgi:AcrR family transcriptional regulator
MNIKKSTYHHGNLREVLISSALEILKEATPQDLSLRALARKAGVSQTAPYRHFEDKEALIVVLIEEGGCILHNYMREARDRSSDPLERLENLGVSYYEFACDHSAHFRLMFDGCLEDKEKYPSLLENEQQGHAILNDVVMECLQLPQAPKLSMEMTSITCWSLVHGLANLILNGTLQNKTLNEEEKHKIVKDVVSFFTRSFFDK